MLRKSEVGTYKQKNSDSLLRHHRRSIPNCEAMWSIFWGTVSSLTACNSEALPRMDFCWIDAHTRRWRGGRGRADARRETRDVMSRVSRLSSRVPAANPQLRICNISAKSRVRYRLSLTVFNRGTSCPVPHERDGTVQEETAEKMKFWRTNAPECGIISADNSRIVAFDASVGTVGT